MSKSRQALILVASLCCLATVSGHVGESSLKPSLGAAEQEEDLVKYSRLLAESQGESRISTKAAPTSCVAAIASGSSLLCTKCPRIVCDSKHST